MRPIATISIGDSVTMAVIAGGVVAGMGRQGTFDPLNPVDIGAVDPGPEPVFNPFSGPDCSAITQAAPFALPMTMHQRLYLWPEPGVGPVNTPAGIGTATVPKEIPAGQADFAVGPIPLLSIEAPVPRLPGLGLDTEAVIPQRGGKLRDKWTVYQTHPWAVTPLIQNLVGDSKVFRISGVTYNNTGLATVAGCRIVAICSCSLGAGKPGYTVAETVSDGSGNYAINVTSRDVQVFAYKAGSPDLVGSTKDIAEGVANIYLRDPTAADPTPAQIATAVWTATGRTLT
jgi:hypothetical protein